MATIPELDPNEWVEPEVHYTWKQWLFLLAAVVFLYIEFKTMWVWCKWFTNC